MDWFKKQKMSSWIILFLAVLNVITLISLWAVRLDRPAVDPADRPGDEKRILNFFRKELALSESQAGRFRMMRNSHFTRNSDINSEIDTIRQAIVDAALAETPDSLRIRQLAAELGELHAEREIRNAEHFLRLRQVIQPEQKQRFNRLMYDMLPGSGRMGRRSGRGRGQQNRSFQGRSRSGRGYQAGLRTEGPTTAPDTAIKK